MLHGVCGLPMVLWPVRAALRAGAGRIVVVDSPAQALREVLPEGVELAVQAEPSGTAGAVLAAISHLHSTPAANGRVADGQDGGVPRAVVVLSGAVLGGGSGGQSRSGRSGTGRNETGLIGAPGRGQAGAWPGPARGPWSPGPLPGGWRASPGRPADQGVGEPGPA